MWSIVCSLLLLAAVAWGQQINSAEYWIDSDPGAGNGSPLTISSSDQPVFSGNVNTSALPLGLHTLGVRFRDDRNIWASSEVRLFYVLGGSIAANITAAEYWLDSDPGAGNGTALTVTPGVQPLIIDNLPFQALANGLHSLGVRFKDDRNIWGSSEARLFYVLGGSIAANITAAEYWLDSDPGAGNGTALTVTPGVQPLITDNLPFQALANGLHTLGVRFRDDRNIWSSSEVRLFYVLSGSVATNLNAAEYWVDTDPGAGNGTSLAMTPGTNPVVISNLPLSALPTGLHSVGVRFKDDRNIWGSSEVKLFYVISPLQATAAQRIAGAEYFINYDPGFGNGAQIPLPSDGNWDGAFEAIVDSIENIPGGKHWLGVRFRDDRGIWSSSMIDSFMVIPILTIKPVNPPVLDWTSDGATMFYVYRATTYNGPFALIDSTASQSYTDNENPHNGTNTVRRYYYVTQRTDGGLSAFRLPNLTAVEERATPSYETQVLKPK